MTGQGGPGDLTSDGPEADPPEALERVLLTAASETPGLILREEDGRREFLVGSRVVATLQHGVAEFRLDPAVVAAALRTPDTAAVVGAPDRVAFSPRKLDRYAIDRALAWLRSAIRRAG